MASGFRAWAALAALVFATGCDAARDVARHDYRLNNPLRVERRPMVLAFQPAALADGFQKAERQALTEFAETYVRAGEGSVQVQVGAATDDDAAAREAAWGLAATLVEAGLREDEIELALIVGEPARPMEARLSFQRNVAVPPECYEWSGSTFMTNEPSANFGCAVQRNIGAMVANPRDLTRARRPSGRDGARAADMLNKYRTGVETSTWAVEPYISFKD
ncbi:MAG: CpaD family pilus assembly protein [Alphaproteobacteria bacterium]|nr:CpaD family pilus assembly protein [Alphaproteobacteria bacterium]